MRKFISFSVLLFAFCLHAPAQKSTASTTEAKATEEIRSSLASRLALSNDVIEKILPIENEFHASMASIRAEKDLSIKERDKRAGTAHAIRRTKLMEIPLTGRQMEDVIILVETIRRKHKL